MAISKSILCHQCKEHKYVYCSPSDCPNLCDACERNNKVAVRTAALTEMANRSLDVRLATIEAWIYDHRQVNHERSIHDMRF